MHRPLLFLLIVLTVQSLTHADLLVRDIENNAVRRYDNNGIFLGDFIPADNGILNVPRRLLETPDGDILVSMGDTSSNSAILRYDTNGNFLGNFTLGGSLFNIHSMRFGPDGDLYVGSSNNILQFNGKNGSFVRTVFSPTFSTSTVTILFEETTGDMLIKNGTRLIRVEVDYENQRDDVVLFEDNQGNGSLRFTLGPSIGVQDDVYIQLGNFVNRVSALDGSFLQTFVFEGPNSLVSGGNAISFGQCGDLFIADRIGKQIEVFDGQTGGFKKTLINVDYDPSDFIFVGPTFGDLNNDGIVDLLDIQPFVDVLTTGTFIDEADINRDGIVDLLDVAPFVELLTCD